eukprot:3782140-Rhodomonas_salina.1
MLTLRAWTGQALEEASCGNTELINERLVEPLKNLENDFKQYEKLVEQSLDLVSAPLTIPVLCVLLARRVPAEV